MKVHFGGQGRYRGILIEQEIKKVKVTFFSFFRMYNNFFMSTQIFIAFCTVLVMAKIKSGEVLSKAIKIKEEKKAKTERDSYIPTEVKASMY